MQYTLLIYSNPDDTAAQRAPFDDWTTYTEAMRASGAFAGGAPLQPKDTATTLRLRGGKRVVTDGPFAETKELLIGFYIVEAPDLDAALDWASRMPDIGVNSVEVRPVMAM